uniref:Peripheral myelin protein 22 n=1 Tax=Cyanistes caeruleus TaxID=156563 RepID=A0A8C0ZCJ6_CYACU
MAAVCPSHDDPLRHLQHPVAVPVLLPALHAHQGWQVLHHWSLPDPGGAVRDERRCHLHSEAHRLAPSLGKHLLRLRLHPGVAGLPAGPGQRHHLRHPPEARVTSRDVAWRGRGIHDVLTGDAGGPQKMRKRKRKLTKKPKKGINPPIQTKPNRLPEETLKGFLGN